MKRIFLNFDNLDEDTQEYLIEKSKECVSSGKKEDLKRIADSEGIDYEELLRTEAEYYLNRLDIKFSI